LKPRNTLIVVALFALLLGYVYFVELNKTPAELGTPVPTPQPQVLNLTVDSDKSIEIGDLRSQREFIPTRSDEGWQVVEPQAKPADSPAIDSTLASIASLQASRVLTNVTDLGQFGFITATLEVRLVMSDTTPYALTVGNKTPDGSNYYAVYTGDKSKVFIIPSSTFDSLVAWLGVPPYQPTATPTMTPTPPVTPTIETTETITPTVSAPETGPTAPPPNIVPTVAIPTPVPRSTP
jgi:hypothetical protein